MNYLDLKQLEAFQALAESKSFTQAAKRLHLTQSAISHSIRSLESHLDCKLFHRMGKKTHLTHSGEVLLANLPPVFQSLSQARKAVEELANWGCGRIRIGASATVCQYILPGVLREFKECFPEADLAIHPGDTPDSLEALLENRVDLALTMPPSEKLAIDFRPIYSDDLRLVVAPNHPLARKNKIQNRDLRDETFIFYQKRSHTFDLVRDHFHQEGWELGKTMELGNMQAIKDFVRIGLGISFLPPWMLKPESHTASLVALSLGSRKVLRPWGISTLRGKKLTLMEDTFCGLCQSQYKDLPDWDDLSPSIMAS
ncbi:MAG: LysR family transcriptional regulator [Opitutales bacterium]|nr:LysR family transcriptional regulator [Opitutales bacterium]MCH8540505.1 LysR family transcriptional regulator [Opitutales bacterium]